MLFCSPNYTYAEGDDEFQFCFSKYCMNVPKPITIWKADCGIINSYGTLILNYKHGCNGLYIYLNGSKKAYNHDNPLKPGDTFAHTFTKLDEVAIVCKNPCFETSKKKCCGTVCISLHYCTEIECC